MINVYYACDKHNFTCFSRGILTVFLKKYQRQMIHADISGVGLSSPLYQACGVLSLIINILCNYKPSHIIQLFLVEISFLLIRIYYYFFLIN